MIKLYISFLILSIFSIVTIQAQQNKADSLINIFEKNKYEISPKQVDLLCEIARLLPQIDAKKSREYATKAINMAYEVDYPLGLGRGNLYMGYAYYVSGDYEKAVKYYLEAIKIQEKHDYKEELVPSLRNLGACFFRNGEYNNALEYFEKALTIAIEIKNQKYIAGLYNNIASILHIQDKYDEARENYFKALEGYRKLNFKRGEATALSNIASTYRYQKQHIKAIQYYEQALAIDKEFNTDYTYGMITTLRNIANLCITIGNYEKAVQNLDEALKHAKLIKSKAQEQSTYWSYAQLYEAQGNYKEAIKFREKSNTIRRKLYTQKKNKQIAEMRTKYETEKKEQQIKDLEQKSKIDALELEKKNLKLKEATYLARQKEQEIESLEQKSKIDALELEKKNLKIKEANYQVEKKKQEVKNLKQKSKIDALELEKKNLQLRQSTLNLIILLVALILLILTGLILYLFARQKRLKLEQKSQSIEQKLLRVQMNPHFIFNAMIAIQEYMFDTNKQKTSIYLTKFSKLIRQILENSRSEYIALEEEVNMLENYLSLQKLRQRINFDYEIIIDDNIDTEEIAIPPMFAQPFVENAIEHGITELSEQGKIQIHFTLENNQIVLKVEDNGIGIQKSTEIKENLTKEHKSLATQITKERIEIFKRSLKKDIGFKIQELKQGTAIIFRLPYQYT